MEVKGCRGSPLASLSSLYILLYCILCCNCARIRCQAYGDLQSSKHECYRLERGTFEALCSTTGGLGTIPGLRGVFVATLCRPSLCRT